MTRSTRHILVGGLLVAALAASGAAVASAASSASSAIKITNCTHAVTKPRSLTLACADANTLLRSLSWSSFGSATARAQGTLETNACTPNCASGKFVKYPVTVRASGVRTCARNLRVYKQLSLTFTSRKPRSASTLSRWQLPCPA